MAALSSQDLLKIARNAFKRVHNKEKNQKIDRRERPWLTFLESKRKDSGFEGGVVMYPLQLSFSDPGTTWSGDDEIEAIDPDFSLNMEYGYFNYTTAMIFKHDRLTRLGFSIKANGEGTLQSRAMGKDMAFKIQDYVKNQVEGFKDNHDRYLDRLLLRSGAASPNDPVGLFGILSESTTTGLVGGLDKATYPQVRHQRQTGLTSSAGGDFRSFLEDVLALANQFSHSNGVAGRIDFMMAGSAFIKAYKNWGELNNYQVHRMVSDKLKTYDFAIPDDALQFEGVPIIRNYSMDDLDSIDTFSPTCTKLLVGLNSKSWHFKSLPGKYKSLSSPQDPPKQRVSREDIDTTAHLACDAPASNMIAAVD